LTDHSFDLIDHRALLTDQRALSIDHRALLIDYRALLIDRRSLLIDRWARSVEYSFFLIDRRALLSVPPNVSEKMRVLSFEVAYDNRPLLIDYRALLMIIGLFCTGLF